METEKWDSGLEGVGGIPNSVYPATQKLGSLTNVTCQRLASRWKACIECSWWATFVPPILPSKTHGYEWWCHVFLKIQPGQLLSTFQQILMFLGDDGRKGKKGKILLGSLYVCGLGSFWDPCTCGLGSCGDPCTCGLGFCWDPVWIPARVGWGSFWDRFVISSGSFHGWFGIPGGPCAGGV